MKTESIFKRMSFVGAACAAMSLAPVGQAGILGSSSLYGEPVTISYLGVNTDTTAGAFLGGTFNGGSIPPFWCIDLIDHVAYPPWFYPDYTEAPFQSAPLTFTSTQVSNLETLFFNDYSGALSSTEDAAAFQLAIWDVLFDGDHNLSTYGGSGFGVVSIADASAESLAQSWINTAVSGTQHPDSLIQLTNSSVPAYQSFVYAGPSRLTTVPEPTGLALLGAGLVAMMLVTRRRRTDGQSA